MAYLFLFFLSILFLSSKVVDLSSCGDNLSKITALENELADFLHQNPLPIEDRITLVQYIFVGQTELFLENDQKFPKMDSLSDNFSTFSYENFINKIKRENFGVLTKNLWQNALQMAQKDHNKYHFLVEDGFYENVLSFLAKIAEIKVTETMKQRNQTEKVLAESTEENAIVSSGWMSLQLFVEMYSFGLELFMQVAGIKNCITKYSKKIQKIILKVVSHQMPQLEELGEAFVDYFQEKFMHNMPQNFKIEPLEALDEDFVDFFREKFMHNIPPNFTIEPLNTQKIIDQNDTCKAWINWFKKVGLVHSEN